MTSENQTDDVEMVECEDGVSRPIDECVECDDGEFRPEVECVEINMSWFPRSECVQDYNDTWILRSEAVRMANGDWADAEDDAIVCRIDGEYDFVDDCCEISGEWYSSDDCSECIHCGDWVHNDDVYTTSDSSEPMCRGCYEDNTTCCDECGDTHYIDDVHYDEDTDSHRCHHCRERRPALIAGYSDKSANKMRPESNDEVLFGVELEVEAKGGDARAGAEWVRQYLPTDYCVLKSDGSLGAGGFEIVTRPDSVAVHRKKWSPMLTAKPTQRLTSWTNGRCGMHVHVSRRPLTELQIGKMMCFLNDPFNEKFVIKIAGRRSDRWGRIEKKKLSDVRNVPERYVALNLCNSKTIEFRIFKGTLSEGAFFKNLEFCEALVEFTSPCGRSIQEATDYREFLKWVPYKKYPHLYEWLVRREWIADKRPRDKRQAS